MFKSFLPLMKRVVEDRVSIELLPGISLRPQVQPGVVLPEAGVGLSKAGPCLAVSVRGVDNVTFFLPPRLSSVAPLCFIADDAVAAVVVSTVVDPCQVVV